VAESRRLWPASHIPTLLCRTYPTHQRCSTRETVRPRQPWCPSHNFSETWTISNSNGSFWLRPERLAPSATAAGSVPFGYHGVRLCPSPHLPTSPQFYDVSLVYNRYSNWNRLVPFPDRPPLTMAGLQLACTGHRLRVSNDGYSGS